MYEVTPKHALWQAAETLGGPRKPYPPLSDNSFPAVGGRPPPFANA